MKKPLLLLLVLLFCSIVRGADSDFASGEGAAKRDSVLVDSLYNEAISRFMNNKLEEGLEILDTMLILARKSGQYYKLILAENDRVRALEFLGMNSLEVLKAYDAIDREIHPLMNQPTPAHAKTWYNLGMWYHGAARFHLARDYLQQAVAVMEGEEKTFDLQRSMIYNVLGMCHEGLGDHSLAVHYFRESIALRASMFGENSQRTIRVRLNLIATLVASGDYDGAEYELEEIRKGLESGGVDPMSHRLYMECKADILKALGDYNGAIEAFERFELLSERSNMVEDMEVEIVVDRSTLLTHLQRWDEAESALRNKLASVGGDNVKVYLYKGLADLYLHQGRPSMAVKYADIAESYYFPGGRSAVIVPSDLVSGVKHSLSALASTAKALDLYADSTDHPSDRRAVLEMIDDAGRIFAIAMRRADAGELIQLREQGWFEIYEIGMKNAYVLHKQGGSNEWVERAWKLSEDSKSAALLTSVNRLGPEISKVKPADEVEKEMRLRNELGYYAEELKEGNLSADNRKVFLQKRLALDSLMETYQSRYPEYSSLRFDPVKPSLEDAITKGRSGRSVLSYLCGENSVYGIAVTKSGAHFEVLGRTDTLSEAISAYRTALNTRPEMANFEMNTKDLKEAAGALFETLVSPLLNLTDLHERLLIIPDGPLHFLPFETLNAVTSHGGAARCLPCSQI
ncbi:MAG: CHAT domain-containing protein [Flavobacteriales bacterium]|nr:CHAT domain-containing protein [Flavobacteriales bacterium]